MLRVIPLVGGKSEVGGIVYVPISLFPSEIYLFCLGNELPCFLLVGVQIKHQIAHLPARTLNVFEAVACGGLGGIPPNLKIVLIKSDCFLGDQKEWVAVNADVLFG